MYSMVTLIISGDLFPAVHRVKVFSGLLFFFTHDFSIPLHIGTDYLSVG